jgi:hypothetical protein
MMLFKLAILLCLIVSVNSLSPKSEYFNISQQVLDITWGIDVIQPRFDLQRFLCDICDQLIGVAKVYVRNNNVLTGEHLIGFLSSQQYFQEFYVSIKKTAYIRYLKESCSQQYDKSSAKSGNFLACSTVLEPIVEELKQILQQKGPNIGKCCLFNNLTHIFSK